MFSFNIEKPADMAATIEKLNNTIKKSGGTFTGDEQSGSFATAKGDVAGEYLAGDNDIKITITKKPFIAPKSLIEDAVRKFFR